MSIHISLKRQRLINGEYHWSDEIFWEEYKVDGCFRRWFVVKSSVPCTRTLRSRCPLPFWIPFGAFFTFLQDLLAKVSAPSAELSYIQKFVFCIMDSFVSDSTFSDVGHCYIHKKVSLRSSTPVSERWTRDQSPKFTRPDISSIYTTACNSDMKDTDCKIWFCIFLCQSWVVGNALLPSCGKIIPIFKHHPHCQLFLSIAIQKNRRWNNIVLSISSKALGVISQQGKFVDFYSPSLRSRVLNSVSKSMGQSNGEKSLKTRQFDLRSWCIMKSFKPSL